MNCKKITLLVILILSALIIISILIILESVLWSKTENQAATEIGQVSNLYITKNEKFKFYYPNNWEIKEEEYNPNFHSFFVEICPPLTGDPVKDFSANRFDPIQIRFSDNPDNTPMGKIEGYKSYLLSPQSGYINIDVDGRNVIYVPDVPGMLSSDYYLIPLDGYIVEIIHMNVNEDLNQKEKDIIQQIISTLSLS
ncbi:MAG: PsbP-related protein [Patescibacteria group bacterium]|nr:PsbP-related protein [Patescibacteria group bacterium]MDD5490763.1 PsbP-related protein [Patescibacteria group bacterium]